MDHELDQLIPEWLCRSSEALKESTLYVSHIDLKPFSESCSPLQISITRSQVLLQLSDE